MDVSVTNTYFIRTPRRKPPPDNLDDLPKEERKRWQAVLADRRAKDRKRAAALGVDGPPLLRVMKAARPRAKTPEEKAQRAIERKSANLEACRRYRENNKEKKKASQKRYADKNREKILEKNRSPAVRARDRARSKQLRLESPQAKTRRSISKIIGTAFRKRSAAKSGRTVDLIGCTFAELVLHLERQFTKKMSWENYGRFGWHIDHIRPCASFDLTDQAQQKECFHFTNLRPLWHSENLRKGANIELLI